MFASGRFSVVLPVRNGGEHVKLCVASVLAQTRADDFELLVLDNASTDGTSAWLASLRDPRVRLYPADRPLSIEENWARVKNLPKREYLTTIGHDDLLDPDFLEVIAGLIRDHPDAGLYATHFRLIDATGALLRPCQPMPGRETAAEFLAARLCLLRDSFGTGHVFRSAAYDAAGGIPAFPKLLHSDDALFMRLIGNSYRATALEEAFSYRLHAASMSGHAMVTDVFAGLDHYARWLDDLQRNDPAVRTVLGRYFADYTLRLGKYRLHDERTEAYFQHRRMKPEIRRNIVALAAAFGTGTQPFQPDDLRSWLMEKAAVSLFYRTLFRLASAMERGGLALYQRGTDRVRSALGYPPATSRS